MHRSFAALSRGGRARVRSARDETFMRD